MAEGKASVRAGLWRPPRPCATRSRTPHQGAEIGGCAYFGLACSAVAYGAQPRRKCLTCRDLCERAVGENEEESVR